MLTLQDITYVHPDGDALFAQVNLVINKNNKIALIGDNGTGKSTLLRILAAEVSPSGGTVNSASKPYYVPQLFGQFNDYTIAEALQVSDKLTALYEILDGVATAQNMDILNDDWTIEDRCHDALKHWKLKSLDLQQKIGTLSGGQKTKIFLAGLMIHKPDVVLLDEPTNHLDTEGRNMLQEWVRFSECTLVVVSHDRSLLNLFDQVCELSSDGIKNYGGNYDFYKAQKQLENEMLMQTLKTQEKALRKAKETEKEALARQQKLDARGKKKQEKAGLPKISMNTFKNRAENSTSRMKDVHTEKVTAIARDLTHLRQNIPEADRMKMGFEQSTLHHGKVLVDAHQINVAYGDQTLWKHPLTFRITSGERLLIKGINGSGKTTLIKLILGEIAPKKGCIMLAAFRSMYIDQDYSLIDNTLPVYEQAQKFNSGFLQEHEVKTRLSRFLFSPADWDKPCGILSGGEKMRLMLCCLTIRPKSPDLIVLDEPTNNLDIQNIEILTQAINGYKGTLLVISHDIHFISQLGIENTMVI